MMGNFLLGFFSTRELVSNWYIYFPNQIINHFETQTWSFMEKKTEFDFFFAVQVAYLWHIRARKSYWDLSPKYGRSIHYCLWQGWMADQSDKIPPTHKTEIHTVIILDFHPMHCVWKSQKKSHSILRAKRAKFTVWVDKSWSKMPKMVHFGDSLKTWSLRSNSVTRQGQHFLENVENAKCDFLSDFQTLWAVISIGNSSVVYYQDCAKWDKKLPIENWKWCWWPSADS